MQKPKENETLYSSDNLKVLSENCESIGERGQEFYNFQGYQRAFSKMSEGRENKFSDKDMDSQSDKKSIAEDRKTFFSKTFYPFLLYFDDPGKKESSVDISKNEVEGMNEAQNKWERISSEYFNILKNHSEGERKDINRILSDDKSGSSKGSSSSSSSNAQLNKRAEYKLNSYYDKYGKYLDDNENYDKTLIKKTTKILEINDYVSEYFFKNLRDIIGQEEENRNRVKSDDNEDVDEDIDEDEDEDKNIQEYDGGDEDENFDVDEDSHKIEKRKKIRMDKILRFLDLNQDDILDFLKENKEKNKEKSIEENDDFDDDLDDDDFEDFDDDFSDDDSNHGSAEFNKEILELKLKKMALEYFLDAAQMDLTEKNSKTGNYFECHFLVELMKKAKFQLDSLKSRISEYDKKKGNKDNKQDDEDDKDDSQSKYDPYKYIYENSKDSEKVKEYYILRAKLIIYFESLRDAMGLVSSQLVDNGTENSNFSKLLLLSLASYMIEIKSKLSEGENKILELTKSSKKSSIYENFKFEEYNKSYNEIIKKVNNLLFNFIRKPNNYLISPEDENNKESIYENFKFEEIVRGIEYSTKKSKMKMSFKEKNLEDNFPKSLDDVKELRITNFFLVPRII